MMRALGGQFYELPVPADLHTMAMMRFAPYYYHIKGATWYRLILLYITTTLTLPAFLSLVGHESRLYCVIPGRCQ